MTGHFPSAYGASSIEEALRSGLDWSVSTAALALAPERATRSGNAARGLDEELQMLKRLLEEE
jgi:hypothetical protein